MKIDHKTTYRQGIVLIQLLKLDKLLIDPFYLSSSLYRLAFTNSNEILWNSSVSCALRYHVVTWYFFGSKGMTKCKMIRIIRYGQKKTLQPRRIKNTTKSEII